MAWGWGLGSGTGGRPALSGLGVGSEGMKKGSKCSRDCASLRSLSPSPSASSGAVGHGGYKRGMLRGGPGDRIRSRS
jgi:hypothetical protein